MAKYAQGLGIDEPLAELRLGASVFYEQDSLDSITSLTSLTASLLNTYAYDTFGNLTASIGSFVNPYLYTGRDYDPETGLRYYRARYYDPAVGRFISEDPAGFMGGDVNFYAYVMHDLIDFSDPSGLRLDPKPGNGAQGGLDLADYLAALQYLNQDAQAAAIIANLEARQRVFPVVFIHDGNDRFDPVTGTIYWDPRSALGGCDHGGSQTPALGLYHEMTHGAGDGPISQGYAATPDAQYDTREERRVIRTFETPFALRHGEGIRHSHGGNPYDSIGPTSITPALALPHGPALPIPAGLQRGSGCSCGQ